MWWSKGDIRFARGGSRQPSEREPGVGGVAAERHCSCRLPTLPCVRERSRAFQVRDGRPRGKGGDRRALCGRRAPRVQVGARFVGDEVVSWEGGRSSSQRLADGSLIRAVGGVGFL